MVREYTTTDEGTVRREDTVERVEVRERDPTVDRGVGTEVAGWFGETLVRTVVALFGVALLLFALGRITDVNLLDQVVGVLDSGIAAWLLLAFFGLLLVLAASKSWGNRVR